MASPEDDDLVGRARRAGSESLESAMLENALQELGVGTLVNMSKRGVLFIELRKRHLDVPAPPADFRQSVQSVINEAVCVAARRFVDRQIHGGGFDSRRSSVGTFFVNACLFSFAHEYRRYVREEGDTRDVPIGTVDESVEGQFGPPGRDPEQIAVDRDLIRRALPTSDRLRRIVQGTAEGRSQVEMAVELGMTAEAVSTAIRRYRRRVRSLLDRD